MRRCLISEGFDTFIFTWLCWFLLKKFKYLWFCGRSRKKKTKSYLIFPNYFIIYKIDRKSSIVTSECKYLLNYIEVRRTSAEIRIAPGRGRGTALLSQHFTGHTGVITLHHTHPSYCLVGGLVASTTTLSTHVA